MSDKCMQGHVHRAMRKAILHAELAAIGVYSSPLVATALGAPAAQDPADNPMSCDNVTLFKSAVPATGALGLGLLAAGTAVAGSLILRRRMRDAVRRDPNGGSSDEEPR